MNEIQAGDTVEFSYSLIRILIPILLAIIFAILGVVCIAKGVFIRLGLALLAGAVITGGFIAPNMATSRILVSSQGVKVLTGGFFLKIQRGFSYRNVVYIQKETVRHRGQSSPAWEINYRDGDWEDFELTSLWLCNTQRIEQLVAGHGIRIIN
jgi:hypothetical protein